MSKNLDRRGFLLESSLKLSGLGMIPFLGEAKTNFYKEKPSFAPTNAEGKIKFGVIGINHGHIYSMVEAVKKGGGELVGFYALENDLAADFSKRFPAAPRVADPKVLLEDKGIHMILSSAIPSERADIGIKAMLNGKDYMVDKPGITDLKQLKEVRKVQKQTGRIFSIMYSERFENRATEKAGDLVKAGAIGKVLQTIGTGPHRMNPKTRPEWFFDKKYFGGVITDIASHQFDQFLFFTGSTKAEVVASQVGNLHHPQYPNFEDFGDTMLKGNNGMGYIRVDWFTPDGLKTWGDGRLTILGTDGFIEIRKNIDIAKNNTGNHLYMANNKETAYFDCSDYPLTFGAKLVNDVINRTETAMSQEHCFLAMELALKAQSKAKNIQLS
jgi:predicted dehydrogenase